MPDVEILEQDMANHIAPRTLKSKKYRRGYIGKTKQRKNIIIAKIRARNIISRLLLNWKARTLEHDARQLQKEADKGDNTDLKILNIAKGRQETRSELCT